MSSVLIEQQIIIFSYFRIQLIDFDLRLRKIINVVLNRGSVMAFCAKIFLRDPPGSRWIIRIHKSQLVIYCFQSLANFPLALSFNHETAAKAFLEGTSGPKGQVEFWQNTIGEFSIFALWVREPPQIFIFPFLWPCTVTCSLVPVGGGGGRVRCFCVGICEGSCINPFWEERGPRLSSQKISKIPRPTPPIKNVPSLKVPIVVSETHCSKKIGALSRMRRVGHLSGLSALNT